MNDNANKAKSASQTQRIYDYLLAGNKITPMDALRKFGCMRLASRVCDIREKFQVTLKRQQICVGTDDAGYPVYVMQYWL